MNNSINRNVPIATNNVYFIVLDLTKAFLLSSYFDALPCQSYETHYSGFFAPESVPKLRWQNNLEPFTWASHHKWVTTAEIKLAYRISWASYANSWWSRLTLCLSTRASFYTITRFPIYLHIRCMGSRLLGENLRPVLIPMISTILLGTNRFKHSTSKTFYLYIVPNDDFNKKRLLDFYSYLLLIKASSISIF